MGMSDIRVRRSRLLRATPRRHPDAGTSFGSRTARSRQTVREPHVRMPRRYGTTAPRGSSTNQTALGVPGGRQGVPERACTTTWGIAPRCRSGMLGSRTMVHVECRRFRSEGRVGREPRSGNGGTDCSPETSLRHGGADRARTEHPVSGSTSSVRSDRGCQREPDRRIQRVARRDYPMGRPGNAPVPDGCRGRRRGRAVGPNRCRLRGRPDGGRPDGRGQIDVAVVRHDRMAPPTRGFPRPRGTVDHVATNHRSSDGDVVSARRRARVVGRGVGPPTHLHGVSPGQSMWITSTPT